MLEKLTSWILTRSIFSHNTEELSLLELIGKIGSKTNEIVDDVNKKVNVDGDFLGTWKGLTLHQTEEGVTGELTSAKGSYLTLTERLNAQDKHNKNNYVNVLSYGAVGDFNGVSGTDNIDAFERAAAAIPATGGTIVVPPGDYYFSEGFEIWDKSNVTLIILKGARLISTNSTASGGMITFRGTGESLNPTIKNCSVVGGGTIETRTNTENPIGFVRCEGCYVEGMTLIAGQKALTTQEYNKDIYFIGNTIVKAGENAITSESGAITLETGVENAYVINNIINNSVKGVVVTHGPGYKNKNINIIGNIINVTKNDGIQVSLTDNLRIADNTLYNIGLRGITADNSSNVIIEKNMLDKVVNHGINLAIITGCFMCIGNILNNISSVTPNGYNAINLDTLNIPFSVHRNILTGGNHKFAVALASSGTNRGVFEGNDFAKGQSDADYNYNGWMPFTIKDIFNGKYIEVINKQRVVYGTAMPTTGSWNQGDYVVNTTPTILGSAGARYVVKGWTRITTGSVNTLNSDWVEHRASTGN